MGAVGIVAEYNPFHTGHRHHIAQTRLLLGENRPIVAVMSGNWVQRGECALVDKWLRARLAMEGGADLVLELPTVCAMARAEEFARGALTLLEATGVVDALSFGAEAGSAEHLRALAQCLDSPEYEGALGELVSQKNLPFAALRQRAAAACVGREAAALLARPNCNLAVEYLRAAPPSWDIAAIPRRGAGHDSPGESEGFRSASALRALIREGESLQAAPFLPRPWPHEAAPADMAPVERAMLARWRAMKPEDWEALPDGGGAEGLSRRLARAGRLAEGLEHFLELAKTKRYPRARLRRLAVWAWLGPPEGRQPQYLRPLAFNRRGRELLAQMRRAAKLPLLTKPAHAKNLPPAAVAQFEAESGYTDRYGLCFPTAWPAGREWTTSPQLVDAREGP